MAPRSHQTRSIRFSQRRSRGSVLVAFVSSRQLMRLSPPKSPTPWGTFARDRRLADRTDHGDHFHLVNGADYPKTRSRAWVSRIFFASTSLRTECSPTR